MEFSMYKCRHWLHNLQIIPHYNSRLRENETIIRTSSLKSSTTSGRVATLALVLLEAGINQSIPFHSVMIEGPAALLWNNREVQHGGNRKACQQKAVRHINIGNGFNEIRLLLFCLYFYLVTWLSMQTGSEL